MNLTVILVAGALLAAPVGYLTYETIDAPAARAHVVDPAGAAAPDAAPAAQAGRLVVRIHHDGQTLGARLGVASEGEQPEMAAITLAQGENLFEYALTPTLLYAVAFETDDASYEPLHLFDARVAGDGAVSFAECDAIDFLLQTIARDGTTGIVTWGAECVPGPMRHVGVEASGLTVLAPFPTCPLDCGMQYSWGGSPRLELEVPEGATRIVATAWWDAESPLTQELSLWLTTPDEECGEGCHVAVATEKGEGEITLAFDAPEAGIYGLSTHLTGPAAAAVQQDVWLHVTVEP